MRESALAFAGVDHGLDLDQKYYYSVGHVSRLLGVKPHIIRYWESQFRCLRPFKTSTKRRLYRREDVESLLMIRRLLHEQNYSIEGAKKIIRDVKAQSRNDGKFESESELALAHTDTEKGPTSQGFQQVEETTSPQMAGSSPESLPAFRDAQARAQNVRNCLLAARQEVEALLLKVRAPK